MATKRQPKEQPEQQPNKGRDGGEKPSKWTPPRGIRFAYRPDRPNAPFYLYWRDSETGQRKATGYRDAKAREAAAKELAGQREKHGATVFSFDPRRWARYLDFQKIVGEETNPILVAHEWVEYRQGIGKNTAQCLTVREAFDKYRALRKSEEKLSDDTWRHIDKHVGARFCGE